jgi:ATP-binding cassette subfamily C (CFTR/MRP) protein 1
VDTHVGKAILENCLLNGPLENRTRILVTHSLHILDKTDCIYVMEDGIIIEAGTYLVRHLHLQKARPCC